VGFLGVGFFGYIPGCLNPEVKKRKCIDGSDIT